MDNYFSKKKSKNKKEKEKEKDKEVITEELETKTKLIYGDRFEILTQKLLGKGSFGRIYLSKDLFFMNKLVALKVEYQQLKKSKLPQEKVILEQMSGEIGFPHFYSFGIKDGKNFIAMETLGPNLHSLFDYCNKNFSLRTVAIIAIQALSRIETLHRKGLLHRDIKPENFAIGIEEKTSMIYLIDFGLSKRYLDSENNHIPYIENKSLTGTARWASINNHFGIEQSRRDDLESLGYILVYFLLKSLPWQGVNASNKLIKYKKIMSTKMSITVENLCQDLPTEFCRYLNYVKALKFNERPDYQFLRELFFRILAIYYPEQYEFDFEWNRLEDENDENQILSLAIRNSTKSFKSTHKSNNQDDDDITEDLEHSLSELRNQTSIENFYNN